MGNRIKIEELEAGNTTAKYQIIVKKMEAALNLLSYTIEKK